MKKSIALILMAFFCMTVSGAVKESPRTVRKILTATEAHNSVIYLCLPDGAYGALAITGSDTFISEVEGANIALGHIEGKTKKVYTFQMQGTKGAVGTAHVTTKSGKTYSIIATNLGKSGDYKTGEVVAKAVIK